MSQRAFYKTQACLTDCCLQRIPTRSWPIRWYQIWHDIKFKFKFGTIPIVALVRVRRTRTTRTRCAHVRTQNWCKASVGCGSRQCTFYSDCKDHCKNRFTTGLWRFSNRLCLVRSWCSSCQKRCHLCLESLQSNEYVQALLMCRDLPALPSRSATGIEAVAAFDLP